MPNVAYIRVSTEDQNLDRQRDALAALGVEFDPRYVFADKEIGATFERAEYIVMKKVLRSGDTLYIKELDRLGRTKDGIMQEWREITKSGVDIVVMDMPILDTRRFKGTGLSGLDTLITDIVLAVLGWDAEEERRKIKARQREGINAARRRGKKFGRHAIEKPPGWDAAVSVWRAGEATAADTWRSLGLTKSTFYKLIKA